MHSILFFLLLWDILGQDLFPYCQEYLLDTLPCFCTDFEKRDLKLVRESPPLQLLHLPLLFVYITLVTDYYFNNALRRMLVNLLHPFLYMIKSVQTFLKDFSSDTEYANIIPAAPL